LEGHDVTVVEPAPVVWRQVAQRLGLVLDIRVDGELSDPDLATATTDAGCEILTNVSRHSGQRHVSITGSASPTHATIVFADSGRGFMPAVEAFRSGLRSVRSRMEAVGGRAVIESAPGRGTRVTLAWDAHLDPGQDSRTTWSLRTFAPLMSLGVVAVLLNVSLGAPQWLAARSVPVAIAGILAIGGATASASLVDSGSRWLAATVSAFVVVPIILAANTPAGAGPDWRYWYLGALTPGIGALGYRYRPYVAATAGAAAAIAVGAVDVWAGRGFWGSFLGPMPVLVMTATAGQVLRSALDRAWDTVMAASLSARQWRLQQVADEERIREARYRTGAISDVALPLLREISTTEEVTAPRQGEYLLVEAAVRDTLTAPGLMNPELAQVVTAARTRGVQVDIVATDASAGGPAVVSAAAAGAGRLLARILDATEPTSRVRAQWRPADQSGRITISYVGSQIETVEHAARDALAALSGAGSSGISRHGTALLVELG
jgi:hypothetical protein